MQMVEIAHFILHFRDRLGETKLVRFTCKWDKPIEKRHYGVSLEEMSQTAVTSLHVVQDRTNQLLQVHVLELV